MVGRPGEQLGSGRNLGSKLHADVCFRLENSPLELVGGSGDSRVYDPKRNLTELPGSEAHHRLYALLLWGGDDSMGLPASCRRSPVPRSGSSSPMVREPQPHGQGPLAPRSVSFSPMVKVPQPHGQSPPAPQSESSSFHSEHALVPQLCESLPKLGKAFHYLIHQVCRGSRR